MGVNEEDLPRRKGAKRLKFSACDCNFQVNFEHLFTSKEKCSILLRFDRLFRYLWKFSVAVWYCNDTYKSGLDIKLFATINHF